MVFRQGSDPVRLLWKRAGTFGLFLLLIFSLTAVWNVWSKEQESAALRHDAEVQLADLKARESKLSGDITSLNTLRGKEAELRKEYDVGAPGEHLVVIVDTTPTSSVHATTTIERIVSWFHFW